MFSLFAKRFSALHLLLISALLVAVGFLSTGFWSKPKASEATAASCPISVHRLSGFPYISPIVYADVLCESEHLNGIKSDVQQIVDRYKSSGDASEASFYMRIFETNEWTSLNGDMRYEPGSMYKVPMLITALKANELHPGFLDKRVTYDTDFGAPRKANIISKTIVRGQTYTIRELLQYMVFYSDNYATALLQTQLDLSMLQKLFTDVGLEAPNMFADQFYLTPAQISIFMRVIYNAGYLTIEDSETAAEMLSRSEFHDGLEKGLPPHTKIAHKFGEAGTDAEKQLHETALVYAKGRTYVLTVMTKGADFNKLSQLLADVSAAVYRDVEAQAND